MSKLFDLWNTVAGAFGPSGREDAVRETIAEIAGAYIDDVTTDALGNLICRKKGAKNGKKLLFAAHMDSIGVVATYIEDKGFIRFSQIGGLYVGDLLNIQVKFANGTRGVISYEEKTPLKDLTLDNLFIDIGAKDAEEARKLVQIGDFAVYEAPRFEQNGVLCGPYLDNRIGCVTLLLMMEQLADKEIENDLYFVFTAQEEVGLGVRAPSGIIGQAEGIAAYGLSAVVGKGQPLGLLQGDVVGAAGLQILRQAQLQGLDGIGSHLPAQPFQIGGAPGTIGHGDTVGPVGRCAQDEKQHCGQCGRHKQQRRQQPPAGQMEHAHGITSQKPMSPAGEICMGEENGTTG